MIEIPIKAGIDFNEAVRGVQEFANGTRKDLAGIVGTGGITIGVEAKYLATGEKQVIAGLLKTKSAADGVERAFAKAFGTQQGSVTNLRQTVNALKQQRDALVSTSAEWAQYNARVQETAAKLRAAQGVQAGSLTDLRRQRDELIKLRDATSRFAPTIPGESRESWAQLNTQVNRLNGQINAATPGFSKFFTVLGKIATVQAGFIALTSAIGAVTGTINAYIGRTKQVEAFNLALKNVGLTQAETTQSFKEATSIANRLGAPLQQVEKSYQRMVPALRAVGANSKQTDKFIENITARTQTLGLNTEQSGRLLEAFAQVLSKGKLQAEELNQQISELDGAFRSQLADALGVSTAQLTELVEKGKITAPVFVKAVNSMANGVDELRRRIENGNATIQQLQNEISNVNIGILGQIGSLIEPGIRSFLALSLAVANFFQQFAKTELFRTFTTVFNQSAKSIEQFVTLLLKAINAVVQFLNPVLALVNGLLSLGEGFGGLIGIIVNFGGALLIAKAAIAGYKILDNVKTSLKGFAEEALRAGKAQDFLAGKTNPTKLDNFRQSTEKVRAGLVGLSAKAKDSISSFLGLDKAFEKTAQGLGKTKTAIQLTEQELKAYANATNQSRQSALEELGATVTAQRAKLQYGNAVQQATAKTVSFTTVTRQAAGALKSLGASAAGAGARLGAALGNLVTTFINPVTIATFLIGGFVENLQVSGRVAKEVEGEFSGVFEVINAELDRIKQSSSAVPKTLGQASTALQQSSGAADQAGQSWRGGAIALGILSVGLAVFTAGTSLAVTGAIAAGAAALGAAKAFEQSNKQLEKSAFGRGILDQSKKVEKGLGSIESRIKGLGGEIGQTDFSQFGKGSTNIVELSKSFKALAQGRKEYLGVLQEQQKSATARGDIKEAEAIGVLIGRQQQLTQEAEASSEASSRQVAALIAGGDAAAAQAGSLEELKLAQEAVNNAIDISKLEAQTEALNKYGNLQSQKGQLEAASLAIEKSASAESLKQSKLQLDALQQRVNKGETLNEQEKKYSRELTKIVAEETKKQVEIQQQLNDAIIKGFEDGVRKAREVAGVYGQIAQKQKGIFDGIASGVTSGLNAALSLVDVAAATELDGLEKGSARRQQILQEQVKAAALVNQTEAQIAQFKLAVQNRIAQNEAQTAALRYQTEARIAAARGDFNLAKAYTDAAAAQGGIIQGLQKQYELESAALEVQKKVKDQQIAQKAIQDGAYKSWGEVAYATGIQKVNLSEATGYLNQLASKANGLVQSYGNAAMQASNLETEIGNAEQSVGDIEASKIKQAFDEAKTSVTGIKEELQQAKDPVFALLDGWYKLNGQIETTKAAIQEIDKIISKQAPNVPNARAMGGPVSAGSQYLVNDGGGREGFLNKFGNFSMLPPGRNLNWTASTAGTIIPAHLVDQYKKSSEINRLANAIGGSVSTNSSAVNRISSTVDSGNLIQRVASAMSGSGSTQRITNNVTIQSQEPVADASKIMTNVARMKLRNSRRI